MGVLDGDGPALFQHRAGWAGRALQVDSPLAEEVSELDLGDDVFGQFDVAGDLQNYVGFTLFYFEGRDFADLDARDLYGIAVQNPGRVAEFCDDLVVLGEQADLAD